MIFRTWATVKIVSYWNEFPESWIVVNGGVGMLRGYSIFDRPLGLNQWDRIDFHAGDIIKHSGIDFIDGDIVPRLKCSDQTKNKYMIFYSCGYHSSYNKEWNQNERTITKDFQSISCVEYW